jgi:hypothetical protein
LVWGFVISTTLLFHGTATINSLSHIYGSKRYDTGDESRNNVWLALITLGEGCITTITNIWVTVRQASIGGNRRYLLYSQVVIVARHHLDLKPVPLQAYERNAQLPVKKMASPPSRTLASNNRIVLIPAHSIAANGVSRFAHRHGYLRFLPSPLASAGKTIRLCRPLPIY